jgi:hypothetical protein
MLTFLVAALATNYLEQRLGLRPVFATLAALGAALFLGAMYAMPMRYGWWALADWRTVWIALAILSCLIIVSIRRRHAVRLGS